MKKAASSRKFGCEKRIFVSQNSKQKRKYNIQQQNLNKNLERKRQKNPKTFANNK